MVQVGGALGRRVRDVAASRSSMVTPVTSLTNIATGHVPKLVQSQTKEAKVGHTVTWRSGSIWSKGTQSLHGEAEVGHTTTLGQSIEDDLEADLVKMSSGHWFLDSRPFRYFVVFFVFANCIQMGLEADSPEQKVWATCELIFTFVFITEMFVKLAVLRFSYFLDRWNALDFFLVWLAVLDLFLKTLLSDDEGGQLKMFSILRVLRLFRLARILRLVRQFERLVLVIQGVTEALQATFWVAIVLLLAIYVAAVFCVSYLGVPDDGTYSGYTQLQEEIDSTDLMVEFNPFLCFGNMRRAMLTLFNIAIMAEWSEVVRPLMVKQPEFVSFFIMFVMFVTFGIMNVIIGMIVDSVMVNAREMQDEMVQHEIYKKKLVLRNLQKAVAALDVSCDGKIDLKELEVGLGSKETGLLSMLGDSSLKLPKGFTASELLCMLDDDGDGLLEQEEFVQSFYRLMDGGQFQQTCMIQMGINAIKRLVKDSQAKGCARNDETEHVLEALMWRQHSDVDTRLARIEASLHKLEGAGEARVTSEISGAEGRGDSQEHSHAHFVSHRHQVPQRHERQAKTLDPGPVGTRGNTSLRALGTTKKPSPNKGSDAGLAAGSVLEEHEKLGGFSNVLPTQPCEMATASPTLTTPAATSPSLPSEGIHQPAPTEPPQVQSVPHVIDAPQPTSGADSSTSGSDCDALVDSWRSNAANEDPLRNGRPSSALSLR